MRRAILSLSCPIVLACAVASADSVDPSAARAQLQLGYDLKQQGNCEAAVPRFVESVRLDRQPKALLNLADCEEKLLRLSAAQAHFVEARDVADDQKLESFRGLAEQRLQALERRMPKLVIRLAKGAPPDTKVTRDGVPLGAVSFNTPLPADPGKHAVVARAGHSEKQYTVTLSEAVTMVIEVDPGSAVADARSNDGSAIGSDAEGAEARPSRGRAVIEIALLGAGVAGLAFGTVEALRVSSKNERLWELCPDQHCQTDAAFAESRPVRDSAGTARTLSMVGFGVGALGLASAAILFFTGPTAAKREAGGLTVVPALGPRGATATLQGTW